MNEEALFAAALERPTSAERQAFLDEACRGDARLRQRVEQLLAADAHARGLLDSTADGRLGLGIRPPDDRPIAEGPGAVIGPYRLKEQIGEGGFGLVFVAEQTEPVRRKVALKVIKPGMDTRQVVARFEQERQALALMDHPNIARVLDGGSTVSGRPFFVMELVKGIAITEFCDQQQFTTRQRLELFIDVCQAVQHAHQKGIIHRDLKPSNVLVTLYDGRPVVKVIDFGVAKALNQQLTERSIYTRYAQLIGTPLYMSPEQAQMSGLDVDTRSDIYSLGVLLYELLTGSTPFDPDRLAQAPQDEVRRILREEEPTRPSTRLSQCGQTLTTLAARRKIEPERLTSLFHGELDWIVMKALEKDRNRRYESASAFARDVQRYLADEPVEASPPSTVYRFRKFVRRNRGAVLAASLIFLSLVGGIAGTTLGLIEARKQRDAAETARLDEGREKDRALRAEQLAQEERAVARAINEFLLEHLLGQAYIGNQPLGPDQPQRNPKITVRELLDRAAKAIPGKFTDQPLVEAAVRQTLADTYQRLGEYALAIPHAERALALRRDRLGPDHPDTLESMNNLAAAYRRAGRLTEALDLFVKVRDASGKRFGPDHQRTLAAMNNLAAAYAAAGKTAEAIDLYARVRDACLKSLGPDASFTLNAQGNLAGMYRLVGKAADAIPLLERVRDAKVKQLGPDDPSTLSTLDKLAEAYHAAGKTAEAIDLYVQVREARVKYFEADHPETLSTSNGLAMTYLAAGRTTDAIALLEQVRDAQARKLEPDHPNALSVLDNLATAYRIDGRTNEAIALHQKVLDARLKALTAEHPETLRTMNNLAVAYQFAGKIEPSLPFLQRAAAGAEKRRFVDETAGQIVKNLIMTLEALNQHPPAETWRRKWLAVVKERSGPRSLAFGAELASLGSNLLKQKKYAEAEPIVRQGLAVFQARDPDAWGTFCTRSLLGGALLGQKRYDEAEPLLLDGYAGMKQRQARVAAAGTVQLTDALQRLVRLYDARGKPDEAARWRKELEKAKAPPKPN